MSVFSPLALTQTLPFLPLAQGDIDYEVARRGEPDLFAKVLAEPATKVILVKDGKVAVPHGQGAIADYANVKMRLAQLPGAYVAAELESHPSALAIFLGSYGGRVGEHVIAVDVTLEGGTRLGQRHAHVARVGRKRLVGKAGHRVLLVEHVGDVLLAAAVHEGKLDVGTKPNGNVRRALLGKDLPTREDALPSRTMAETSVQGRDRSKPVTRMGSSSKPACGTSVPSSLALWPKKRT